MEAKKQIFEAILRPIPPLFLAQNGPNTPKLCAVTLAFNTQSLGELLGAILGVSRAILGLFHSKIKFFDAIIGNISPLFAD